jgi:hypothetical protein
LDACSLELLCSVEVEEDSLGGFRVAEAFVADVGDAVAFGVGASGARLPGDVDAEGVGGAEAGAFAD